MVRETAHEAYMFRFQKPETPRAALLLFFGNETREKSGFVSYVSFSLCFDFDPICQVSRKTQKYSTVQDLSLFCWTAIKQTPNQLSTGAHSSNCIMPWLQYNHIIQLCEAYNWSGG